MPKKRAKKRRTRYHTGSVTSIPRKGSKAKSKTTSILLTDAEVKRAVKRRRKKWGK